MFEKIKQWFHQLEVVELHYMKRICFNLKMGARWMLLAAIVGIVVGVFSSAFAFCLKKVKALGR